MQASRLSASLPPHDNGAAGLAGPVPAMGGLHRSEGLEWLLEYHERLWRCGHLVVCAASELPSGTLLLNTTPLLEEERDS
jgi:hypothetical protein